MKSCFISKRVAVQKNTHLVDLEKCWRMITEYKHLIAKIGVDTAKNEPDADVLCNVTQLQVIRSLPTWSSVRITVRIRRTCRRRPVFTRDSWSSLDHSENEELKPGVSVVISKHFYRKNSFWERVRNIRLGRNLPGSPWETQARCRAW